LISIIFLSSSSSWLLLSATYIFTSVHLYCAHRLLLVHHFIQYIRGPHSSITHHSSYYHFIIRHPPVASGIASSCFSGDWVDQSPLKRFKYLKGVRIEKFSKAENVLFSHCGLSLPPKQNSENMPVRNLESTVFILKLICQLEWFLRKFVIYKTIRIQYEWRSHLRRIEAVYCLPLYSLLSTNVFVSLRSKISIYSSW
jgi:hypothetical protein